MCSETVKVDRIAFAVAERTLEICQFSDKAPKFSSSVRSVFGYGNPSAADITTVYFIAIYHE